MFSVHQQTIRMYEKQGLITPKRSDGNTRLFSEEDVDRLEEVIYLTHKLGVNLAGVEMILKLQKKIKRMQDQMNKIFDDTEAELTQEVSDLKDNMTQQAQRVLLINRQAGVDLEKIDAAHTPGLPSARQDESKNIDDFEIEYEDND